MMRIAVALLLFCVSACASSAPAGDTPAPSAAGLVRVRIQTEAGDIIAVLDSAKAPATVTNFLRYVDNQFYRDGTFYRTVREDNQPNDSIRIAVIQGGRRADPALRSYPPVPLERTSVTGITHQDGTLSMARSGPDSATDAFFICVGDQHALDFGGKRNPDGQGFAAFGRVVQGMDVVRRIHQSPVNPDASRASNLQQLTPRIRILDITRI